MENAMRLIINGKEETIESDELTITKLLKVKTVKMPDMVSVQLNDDILKRSSFVSTSVKENDRINFLYFMGGG
jgi:sulfur carrier protein